MSDDPKGPPVMTGPFNLQIHLDDETAQGTYANMVMINHNETEFILDFVYVQPQQPRAKVRSRVILSPKQAARLAAALGENVTVYEKKFGPIERRPVPGSSDGSTIVH